MLLDHAERHAFLIAEHAIDRRCRNDKGSCTSCDELHDNAGIPCLIEVATTMIPQAS